MRDLEPDPIENENDTPAEGPGDQTTRTKTDVTSLLLELTRALRGFSFYSETDAQRRPLLDRAFRAVSGELSRAGAIDLELGEAGFWIAGLSETVEADGDGVIHLFVHEGSSFDAIDPIRVLGTERRRAKAEPHS